MSSQGVTQKQVGQLGQRSKARHLQQHNNQLPQHEMFLQKRLSTTTDLTVSRTGVPRVELLQVAKAKPGRQGRVGKKLADPGAAAKVECPKLCALAHRSQGVI